MTKKEILKIIELKELILDSEKILSITKSNNFEISENRWFPNINDLKDEFENLKTEVKETLGSVKEAEEELSNLNCSHKVRLRYRAGFQNSSECVFCGKHINGDNISNANTIYNDINRNRKCVMLDGEFDDSWNFYSGYNLKEVYDIIKDILKNKSDNEEINFIEEFKKLNIKDCEIDEREFKKEYYVLIIGGSNKFYLNDTEYITSKNSSDSAFITHFLCGIPNTKVELFESKQTYNSKKFNNDFPHKNILNVRLDEYETIDELNELIEKEKNVPFDLIIDITSLFEYNNKEISEYNLNLKQYFPNSRIINIKNYKKQKEVELLKYLKEKLIYYIYDDEKYYYFEENNIKSNDINKTCNEIKKLILEKKKDV